MHVERVDLPQPHYGPVAVYRVGDTLVDTGHPFGPSQDALRDALDGGVLDGVERVLLTHPHVDHVGGSLLYEPLTDLPHVVFEGVPDLLRDFTAYLREARAEMRDFSAGLVTSERQAQAREENDDLYFPLDREYAGDRIEFERVVSHGDTVRLGEYDCEVVHTPGHSHQHMSLFHEPSGAMLSGDIISTNGHFMYGPLYWDIGEYRTGLERIRERDPDVLYPNHGERMDDPAARVADALEKADRAEAAILAAVAEHGELPARELAVEALGASEAAVDFLTNVASVYAIHLAERGALRVERRPNVVALPA